MQLQVKWWHVGVALGLNLLTSFVMAIGYDTWKKRDGWCVAFQPDGSQEVVYGTECFR